MEMKQNLGVKVLLGLGVACLSGCSFSEKGNISCLAGG